MTIYVKDELECQEADTENSFTEVVYYYLQIMLTAAIIGTFSGFFIWLLSLMPWLNENGGTIDYFSRTSVTILFLMAIVSFGPVYMSFYMTIMSGKKLGRYGYYVIFHIIFWSS